VSCTLKDVAEMAGVSKATASRVVNGVDNVSSVTRARVLSAISRLKYSPDIHAVELRRGKGGMRSKRSTGTGLQPARRAGAQNQRRNAERLRLLEEENARLKRLVTNLSMDVAMWRRIAQ
jgi:transcriptional regulator with XRE-family HTH domain